MKRKHERHMNTIANNHNRVTELINTLVSIRGEGGREAKRRQFADNAMEVVTTGHRVLTANLKEAQEKNTNDDA